MRRAPTRFVPFSYFCTCWKVSPNASPSFSWLMPSMMRRMRTRLPTYLSTGLGALVDIINTPWDYACRLGGKNEVEHFSGVNAVKSCSEIRRGTSADNLSNARRVCLGRFRRAECELHRRSVNWWIPDAGGVLRPCENKG